MGVFGIRKFTVVMNEDMESRLQKFMDDNRIKKKSAGIKRCILEATNKDDILVFMTELDKKLNRILYRQSMNKKLIEQLYCNHGFPLNEKVSDDILLKQFYQDNNNYVGRFD